MADTTQMIEPDLKENPQGGKSSAKNKLKAKMKGRKKSGGKKAADTTGQDESMEITDLDPEGAIGEDNVDSAAHEKLLNSIYAMDGRKRSGNEVRGTGMASSNVDLLVHSKLESAKIKATELKIKSKNVKLVPKPLSVYDTEKAKRQIARDVMEKDTKKWEPIVNEIRVAPQIKYAERPKGVEMYEAMKPQKFSPKTPLEVELYEALGRSEDIITPDNPLTKAEERALRAMSVAEAMARRRELLLHNELLFRSQKVGKRQNKIKSKRYRRGMRMEKMAKTKKSMEDMEKTDPEAYMEKLEKLDEARMEERLTLRHKSGGKFARYHKAFAKYNDSAREAMEEMARKGRELREKRHVDSSDDEEEEMVVDPSVSKPDADDDQGDRKPTASNDLNTKHLDMMKSISKKAGGWLDGTTRPSLKTNKPEETNDESKSTPDSTTSQSNTTYIMTDSSSKKRKRNLDNSEVDEEDDQPANASVASPDKEMSQKKKRKVSETEDPPQKDASVGSPEKESPSKKKRKGETKDTPQKDSSKQVDASPEKSKKKKQIVDEIEIENTIKQIRQKLEQDNTDTVMGDTSNPESSDSKSQDKQKQKSKADVKANAADVTQNKKDRASTKNEVEDVILTPAVAEKTDDDVKEEGEEEEVPVTMEELFEDEDVVEQFAKDKAEEEEKRKPKVEKEVKLPGWGSWSGPDYKDLPKRKKKERRRKFQPRQKPKEKKDEDKNANLWLNPNRDKAIRELQPKRVPFPYTNAEQYAAAIRQPVSRGFVREVAHKILVKPEVVTKLGNIIKPLNKDDFFKDKRVIHVDDKFGKEIKYSGHVNFRNRDRRLKPRDN